MVDIAHLKAAQAARGYWNIDPAIAMRFAIGVIEPITSSLGKTYLNTKRINLHMMRVIFSNYPQRLCNRSHSGLSDYCFCAG